MPFPITVTIWELAVATKLYQTSFAADAPQVGANDCVAASTSPFFDVVQVAVEFTVNAMAPEQLSFTGGDFNKQMVNAPVPAVADPP